MEVKFLGGWLLFVCLFFGGGLTPGNAQGQLPAWCSGTVECPYGPKSLRVRSMRSGLLNCFCCVSGPSCWVFKQSPSSFYSIHLKKSLCKYFQLFIYRNLISEYSLLKETVSQNTDSVCLSQFVFKRKNKQYLGAQCLSLSYFRYK